MRGLWWSILRAICRWLARRFFSRAGAVLMSAYNGGIDHHVFVVVIAAQQLENTLENPALRPSAETLMDRFEVAERSQLRGRRKKKERSGLQSACDELTDKSAFITGE